MPPGGARALGMGGDKCRGAWPGCAASEPVRKDCECQGYARFARRRPCHVAAGVCGEKGATPLGFPLIGKASAAADHYKAREALHIFMLGTRGAIVPTFSAAARAGVANVMDRAGDKPT